MSVEDVNRCVCCGAIIPEGRMVCPACEKEACMHLWEFQGFDPPELVAGAKRKLCWRCPRCGKERVSEPVDRELMYPSTLREG